MGRSPEGVAHRNAIGVPTAPNQCKPALFRVTSVILARHRLETRQIGHHRLPET
jgi:hypothetical protein